MDGILSKYHTSIHGAASLCVESVRAQMSGLQSSSTTSVQSVLYHVGNHGRGQSACIAWLPGLPPTLILCLRLPCVALFFHAPSPSFPRRRGLKSITLGSTPFSLLIVGEAMDGWCPCDAGLRLGHQVCNTSTSWSPVLELDITLAPSLSTKVSKR